jgi:hypothetical protein
LDLFCGPLAYRPTRPESEILSEYLDLWERLYDRGTFLARTYRCFIAMRPTREPQAKSRQETPKPHTPLQDKPWRAIYRDLRHFIRLSWVYGVKPSCRWQYWRYLLDIRRRNPSRLVRFLRACSVGDGMIHLREVVRERIESLLNESGKEGTGGESGGEAPSGRNN